MTSRGSASSRSTTARATSSKLAAAGDRLAVDEAEPRALAHREPVGLGVARGDRHRARGDRLERRAHLRGVRLAPRAARRTRPSRRAPPGASASGSRATGFDACAAACSARIRTFGLFGSRIASGAARRARSRRGALGRRVHRLAAVDDAGRAEALEEPPVALARRRPRRPRSRRRRRAPPESRSSRSTRLPVHVRDLDPLERRRRAVPSESAAPGVVGVDVHLERARVADDEQRVAERLELAARARRASRSLALDDEDRAVAVARELLVDRVERRARPRRAARSGSGSPVTTAATPRTSSSRPAPPASTTPASRSTASCSGVRATASSPRRTSARSSSAARGSGAPRARPPRRSRGSTVSIVPSTGLRTAR